MMRCIFTPLEFPNQSLMSISVFLKLKTNVYTFLPESPYSLQTGIEKGI